LGTDRNVVTFKLEDLLTELHSPEATVIKGSTIGFALWAGFWPNLKGWLVRNS
jgi:hypothetical protein